MKCRPTYAIGKSMMHKMNKQILLVSGFLFLIFAYPNPAVSLESSNKSPSEDSALTEFTVADLREFPEKTVNCKKDGGEIRKVEVRKSSTGGCEVAYHKNGEAEIQGDAKNEATFCYRLQDNIVTNLTSAGYLCQENLEKQ